MSLMVGSKQVNDCCEASVKFITMVGGIRHKIGIFTVLPNDDTVLIVAKICHSKPCCTFRFVEVFFLLKELEDLLWFPAIPNRFLTGPDIKIDSETF